jgi:DNA-binding MarR family transcriptional regulator
MIVENGPVGIIDLSKKLFVDKSTISRVVDLLIEKDYIIKETSLTDGRAIILNVTDKGCMVYQKIERIGIDDMMKMLEKIDPKASRTTIKIITALVKKATKQYL